MTSFFVTKYLTVSAYRRRPGVWTSLLEPEVWWAVFVRPYLLKVLREAVRWEEDFAGIPQSPLVAAESEIVGEASPRTWSSPAHVGTVHTADIGDWQQQEKHSVMKYANKNCVSISPEIVNSIPHYIPRVHGLFQTAWDTMQTDGSSARRILYSKKNLISKLADSKRTDNENHLSRRWKGALHKPCFKAPTSLLMV